MSTCNPPAPSPAGTAFGKGPQQRCWVLGSILWAGLGPRRNTPKLFKTGPRFLRGLETSGLIFFFFLPPQELFACLALLCDTVSPALDSRTRRGIDACEGSQPAQGRLGCWGAGSQNGKGRGISPKPRLPAQSPLTRDLN